MAYRLNGLQTAVEFLLAHPLRTYEETKQERLENGKHDQEYCAFIESEYAINEKNAKVVRTIDKYVRLFNMASAERRLTDKLYQRFYDCLMALIQ